MKKLILIAVLFFSVSFSFSQKFAYVDTDYILNNIPDYSAAKKQINDISVKWQKEIEAKIAEVDKMYQDFQVEKILLSDDMRVKREAEILKKENEVKELQKKRFGVKGDLFAKQQELIKPIQDKVYSAILEVAESKSIGMVFDKAGSTTVVYSQGKYDISDDVIRQMGYEPGSNTVEDDVVDEDDDNDGSSDDNNNNNKPKEKGDSKN